MRAPAEQAENTETEQSKEPTDPLLSAREAGPQRIVEDKITEAQKAGAFDNLPGKGKPLDLEDLSWVPGDLRVAYHILKNAHVLPPEVELLKEIHTLEDLLKYVEDEGERRSMTKSIQWKMVRFDLLKRRSFPLATVGYYGKKLVRKFSGR